MLIERIPDLIRSNETVALVTVTAASGSTPAEVGKEMLVDRSGNIGGTVGGGNLEYVSVKKAQESISRGLSRTLLFDLKKDLGMECGGEVEIFIKVYAPPTLLVLVGAGHVGRAVYQFARLLGYDVVVIDDRAQVADAQLFSEAKSVVVGNIADECEKLAIAPESTYVAIATQGHQRDETALYHLIQKRPKYIGVIGSRNKVAVMMESLRQKGIPQEALDAVYSPVGLALGGGQPAEVALSIISEILLVKNGGSLAHMKDRK